MKYTRPEIKITIFLSETVRTTEADGGLPAQQSVTVETGSNLYSTVLKTQTEITGAIYKFKE